MKLPRVQSFSSYNLSESKRRMGLSVNEDETDDLADDIKGAAPKKTEAPKKDTKSKEDKDEDLPDEINGAAAKKTEAPKKDTKSKEDKDEDLPDEINGAAAKKNTSDSKKDDKKTSVAKDYKINMGLGINSKSNKSSSDAYTTLFIEALTSLDKMAGLGVEVNPDAPAIKNYQSDRSSIATVVGKSAAGLKKAWNKIYDIAGTWPPSGEGITGIIKETLQKDKVYKEYKEEKKKLDDEFQNGKPKLKKEEYDKQLKAMNEKYSEKLDPKKIMFFSTINNAIGLYRSAIDAFRKGADVELGFVEKREGGIKEEDLKNIEKLQIIIDNTKLPKEDRIKAAEKLQKDLPVYFKNIKTEDILNGAIDQIKSGLAESPEKFYGELSDSIENIVLSKSADKLKTESEILIDPAESILENFGGFLGNTKDFVKGVGKGIADGFKGGAKNEPVDTKNDKTSILYAADVIRGNLIGLASEIDNVVAFKKNIHGLSDELPAEYFKEKKKLDAKLDGTPPLERDDYAKQLADLKKKYAGSKDTEEGKVTRKASDLTADEAKKEASEMISFVQDSFKYVTGISKELQSSSANLESIKKKLDEISKQLVIIGRKGGTLEKWKNEVLGENRERVASTSYLEKGRELMQMAAAKMAEANKQKAIEKRYNDRDADKVIKKAIDAFNGKSGDIKPSKIKRKGDVSVFSKNDTKSDKVVVKAFQQRLIDLGHLPAGSLSGEYDEPTKNAAKLSMTYVGSLSGKVYADNEEAFQDFQRDLGFYSDNKGEIKKTLGL